MLYSLALSRNSILLEIYFCEPLHLGNSNTIHGLGLLLFFRTSYMYRYLFFCLFLVKTVNFKFGSEHCVTLERFAPFFLFQNFQTFQESFAFYVEQFLQEFFQKWIQDSFAFLDSSICKTFVKLVLYILNRKKLAFSDFK